jgi:hypothetical protein
LKEAVVSLVGYQRNKWCGAGAIDGGNVMLTGDCELSSLRRPKLKIDWKENLVLKVRESNVVEAWFDGIEAQEMIRKNSTFVNSKSRR